MTNLKNTDQNKTSNQSLIFLKSTTIVLGIVFVVLLTMLLFKQSKSIKTVNNCQKFLAIKTNGEIDRISLEGNNLIIITKPNLKNKTQDIIKIDHKCLNVINQVELQIK